jgi:hypothetical protein
MAIHHHRYSGHPPAPSPGPIKATPTTPGAPNTSPSPSLLLSRAGTPPHRVLVTSLRHRRRPSSSEARAELPVPPSLFCAPAGELWHTGVAGGRALVSAPSCLLSAPASVHDGPSTPGRSTETWTRSTNYPLGNNSLFRIFWKSCKEVPGLLGNQPADQILPISHSGPRVFSEINPWSRIFAVWPEI